MENLLIEKSIEINASKEKVWEVLMQDAYMKKWYAAFWESARAETDWKVGSKVIFTDDSGHGMIGRIISNEPATLLVVEYDGMLKDGKEDLESEEALSVKGGREIYRLSTENGKTMLKIESDMTEEYYEMMSQKWDAALKIIKDLSENS